MRERERDSRKEDREKDVSKDRGERTRRPRTI